MGTELWMEVANILNEQAVSVRDDQAVSETTLDQDTTSDIKEQCAPRLQVLSRVAAMPKLQHGTRCYGYSAVGRPGSESRLHHAAAFFPARLCALYLHSDSTDLRCCSSQSDRTRSVFPDASGRSRES